MPGRQHPYGGLGRGTHGRPRHAGRQDGRTRRSVLRALLASGAALTAFPAGTALGGDSVPVGEADADFDETYRGRRIAGTLLRPRRGAGAKAAGARTAGEADHGQWQVTVDGRPLPLMRRADGSYLSMVDHYRSYPTAREAARAAVDELGPTLSPRPMRHPAGSGGDGDGEGHDVHA